MAHHTYTGRRTEPLHCEVFVDGYPLRLSQRGRQHSPDGFEWGYGGSGPAALAHSILTYEYGAAVADEHYQQFKWDIIANLDQDAPWTLTSADLKR